MWPSRTLEVCAAGALAFLKAGRLHLITRVLPSLSQGKGR